MHAVLGNYEKIAQICMSLEASVYISVRFIYF